MFPKAKSLFTLFGFKVSLDWSWLILAFLVAWSLSSGYFPMMYKDAEWSKGTLWMMGIAGAVGLFISIVFHELSHSLVARKYGLPIKGITLFLFGGVADMHEEPENPKSELLMAIAGPASSFLLAGIVFLVYTLGDQAGFPLSVIAVLKWMMTINIILGVFNCIPAFPTDGGRVFRAILWKWKNNLRWATKIASSVGAGFGWVLVFLGILNIVNGNFIGGMWWVLIGMFLRGASQSSYQQLVVRTALEGDRVRNFMKSDPITVPPSLTIRELVEDYFYKYHYKMFPIVENGEVQGCITTGEVKKVPRDQWDEITVAEASQKCSDDNSISPDTDAVKALSSMNRTENSRLMVMEDGHLTGIVTLKDMLKFLSMKLDLEGYEDESQSLLRRK